MVGAFAFPSLDLPLIPPKISPIAVALRELVMQLSFGSHILLKPTNSSEGLEVWRLIVVTRYSSSSLGLDLVLTSAIPGWDGMR